MASIPTLTDIRAAAHRIRPHIHRTPILSCAGINRIVGAQLFFKCENFQKIGAFKIRGATNAVLSLGAQDAAAGVATHSSGHHAAALALAAQLRRVKAYVVMPATAPQVKKDAVAAYGAQITLCAPTLEARQARLDQIVAATGAAFIPPYNDEHIIAGQATVALELIEDISDLDLIMTPIGGGGLTSGTALVVRALCPRTRVIAAEPKGADDAYRSFRAGYIIPSVNPQTIADGLLTSLGDKTFAIIRDSVDDIVTVGEADIIEAMRLIWERMKIIVEPSAAVPLGALLGRSVDVKGKRVAIIVSGGNVDLTRLPFSPAA